MSPLLKLFIYLLFCVFVGVLIFFAYSFIRKKIEIKQNMKRRQNRDKSR